MAVLDFSGKIRMEKVANKAKDRPLEKLPATKSDCLALGGLSAHRLASLVGESRANGNGPTPVPSPPGTPRKAHSRSSSPSTEGGSPRHSSPSRVAGKLDMPPKLPPRDEALLPASPVAQRALRGNLPREPSIDRHPSMERDSSECSTADSSRQASPARSSRGHSSSRTSPITQKGSGSSSASVSSSGSGLSQSAIAAISASAAADSAMKPAFNIGSASPKDESMSLRLSPKSSRKDRGRQLRTKRERAASPSPRDLTPVGRGRSSSSSAALERSRDMVKEALSPSVAECLRAVYAAFLWHEGIVHDAMACASFLKFHPDLSKDMSEFNSEKKQEKNRIRHATDSSKDHVAESKKGDNLNETRVRFHIDAQEEASADKSERSLMKPILGRHKSEGNVHFEEDKAVVQQPEVCVLESEEAQLPPTLYHLVYFWEELSLTVKKVVSQDIIYPSPAVNVKVKKVEKKEKEKDKEKKTKKKRDLKPIGRGNLFGEAAGVLFAGAAGAERETMCELCGGMFPHPVTYHMRRAHPGCGKHASGKGYNSGGNFCGGWAGNCGEGGIGGSSWYLICDRCRDKYLKERRQTQKEKEKSKKFKKKSLASKHSSTLVPLEPHIILKNNAMFLLDLASAAGISIPSHSHKRTQTLTKSEMYLPSVSEDISTDLNPFPSIPFQYLIQQGAQASDSAFAEDIFFDTEERVIVRSGSLSLAQKQQRYRPRLPTEPRHSPLARSGSLGQEMRPCTYISPPSPQDLLRQPHETKPLPKSAGTSPESDQDQKKNSFQRSISEMAADNSIIDQSDRHFSNRLVVRRRNNSGGVSDGGMSLLKNPSAAMSRLISSVDASSGASGSEKTLQRPVMAFVIQRHDLDNLQIAMRQALRKAICRVFAMQALNWLLRSVTQPTCLHDLLWFFVSALSPSFDEEEEEEEEQQQQQQKEKKERKDQEDVPLCDHPLNDVSIAGAAVHPLPITFHTLLQTIADVMMYLPVGTALQQMAVRCWCLKFNQSDHQFLHESHVFSNISRILGKSDDEDAEEINLENAQHSSQVSILKDLSPSLEIKASSRQAMIASLTDNSTETFWESGDEDRNKTKIISIMCSNRANPQVAAVHIDNTRDLGNKVTHMVFSCGPTLEEQLKVKQVDIEARHIGWVSCYFSEPNCRHIKLEFKGPDNNLRLRQIKVLGELEGETTVVPNLKSTASIQQENCEAETLKVFRLLTSQVFGKLIADDLEEDKVEEKKSDTVDGMDRDNDLKEHMLGILFSRGSKLSHLQKQVCSHIVQAIRKEARRVRDEWENSLLHKADTSEEIRSSDVYCFELLSMVLALSGSSVGRIYLAHQTDLLKDLFSLLHTASPRVQRQVTSVIRRVLPEVHPQVLATLLSVPSLPPTDFSIVSAAGRGPADEEFDPEKPGILDVFLACISKALTVQTKVKSNMSHKGLMSVTLAECLVDQASFRATGPRWWLRGKMTACLAGNIISLLQDMAKGQVSDTWAMVTKAAIAEALLSLTRLDETTRLPRLCMNTPTLWLGLASLCVLDREHVERLSSGEWRSSPDGQRGPPRVSFPSHLPHLMNTMVENCL